MQKNFTEIQNNETQQQEVTTQPPTSWFTKLQTRWGVKNKWQVFIVLLVFALTGTSVLYIKQWLLPFLGVDSQTPILIRIMVSIFVILPVYQVVLLIYGAIFGQFQFFLSFEKKTLQRIVNLFKKKT
jgi:hypothetical protein